MMMMMMMMTTTMMAMTILMLLMMRTKATMRVRVRVRMTMLRIRTRMTMMMMMMRRRRRRRRRRTTVIMLVAWPRQQHMRTGNETRTFVTKPITNLACVCFPCKFRSSVLTRHCRAPCTLQSSLGFGLRSPEGYALNPTPLSTSERLEGFQGLGLK